MKAVWSELFEGLKIKKIPLWVWILIVSGAAVGVLTYQKGLS